MFLALLVLGLTIFIVIVVVRGKRVKRSMMSKIIKHRKP